jgi:hypothetical protein
VGHETGGAAASPVGKIGANVRARKSTLFAMKDRNIKKTFTSKGRKATSLQNHHTPVSEGWTPIP